MIVTMQVVKKEKRKEEKKDEKKKERTKEREKRKYKKLFNKRTVRACTHAEGIALSARTNGPLPSHNDSAYTIEKR